MTEIVTQSKRGRIEYIDGIRGVGALMVAVQHPFERAFPAYLEWSAQYVSLGRVGIVAFFLVSGYVVGLTLSGQTARTFTVRRFWRLYPTYWLATIAYVVAAVATGEAQLDYSIFVIAVNITMIQGFVGMTSILGVGWTLGIEIAFYAQSVLGKLTRLLDKTVWLGLAWLGLFVAMGIGNFAFGTDFSAVMPLMMYTGSVGFALYLRERNRSRALTTLVIVGLTIMPVAAWLVEGDSRGTSGTVMSFLISYYAGAAVFAVSYALRSRETPKLLLSLGATSYALYLFHEVVMAALAPLVGAPLLYVPLNVTASLAIAWAIHLLVEKPSITRGRKLTPTRREQTVLVE
ncbi:acyltransferase [Microbacterium sp. dk485]|uniref:acyltransferase family protein n=1 Tax=Microbacterium sp. dk485 TaxID=2560021 RepID=UPI001074137C|nr:acyltransferase [Microbacterium sp. dk485]TFV84149.1 acyltransferase [Microbacterium sp. dk485]